MQLKSQSRGALFADEGISWHRWGKEPLVTHSMNYLLHVVTYFNLHPQQHMWRTRENRYIEVVHVNLSLSTTPWIVTFPSILSMYEHTHPVTLSSSIIFCRLKMGSKWYMYHFHLKSEGGNGRKRGNWLVKSVKVIHHITFISCNLVIFKMLIIIIAAEIIELYNLKSKWNAVKATYLLRSYNKTDGHSNLQNVLIK